jgi:hypothetical protein
MGNDIILTQVPFDKLIDTLRAVIREEIQAEQVSKDTSLMITGNEVRQLFRPAISRPTLASYVKKGLINGNRIGGRVFYKKGEVMEAVSKIKRYGGSNK